MIEDVANHLPSITVDAHLCITCHKGDFLDGQEQTRTDSDLNWRGFATRVKVNRKKGMS